MRRLLTALFFLSMQPAQAHLLNMTRVQVDFAANGDIAITMSIDLMRAVGGAGDYYRLSLSPEPMNDPELHALLAQLAQAMQLDVDGARVALEAQAATLPQLPESEFHNPMTWPMTEVRLRGALAAPTRGFQQTQARFDPAFGFEEPIAVTLQSVADNRRMTRWLVAGQVSPAFALDPDKAPRSTGAQRERSWATVLDYLRFGFEHILPRGLDHVLFVIGLYLGTRNLRALLVLVTSFTLAHSVTLILSSFGAVRLPASFVEPAIALSIAWIGMENMLFPGTPIEKNPVRRIVLVFLFGLLHGLGFAAALSELGLPRSNFLGALISFNVGVEVGQLAVIALALLAVGWFRHRSWYRRAIVLPCSTAISLLALVWTVQRIAA